MPQDDDDSSDTGGPVSYWLKYKVRIGSVKVPGFVLAIVLLAIGYAIGSWI